MNNATVAHKVCSEEEVLAVILLEKDRAAACTEIEHKGNAAVCVVDKVTVAVTAANQGKIYFEVADITEETEITFTVFVPDRNTTLNGLGEFAIRYKGSSGNGYISFKSAGGDAFPLTKGEWQTFTVKPSDYGTSLTEFAFIIPAGNTVYFTEITFN